MIYSFVVDNDPKFHLQAYYLLLTLTHLGKVSCHDIILHYAGTIPMNFKKTIEKRFPVRIREVTKHDHPYCNKILQLDSLAGENEDIVLLDCDTVIVRPVRWPNIDSIAAKRVDVATPPESFMNEIFKRAGLPITWAKSDCLPGQEGMNTPWNNLNGGVYFFKKNIIRKIYHSWKKWAEFCIENKKLFGKYSMHVDQVAFALSITELGLPVHLLERKFNFPTHLSLPSDYDCDPYILHYHWKLDDQQLIIKTGKSLVDSRIDQVNDCIVEERKGRFNNRIFWDFRYAFNASLGAGIGSRGVVLAAKRDILQRLINAGNYKVILDIGCGDIETTCKLSGCFNYIGIDTSSEALKIAKEKRPDWKFYECSQFISEIRDECCNLSICIDVLIHQPTKADYDAIVKLMCSVTNNTLIVAAYDEQPAFTSSITYYYEPISTSLKKSGLFAEVFTVGRYQDISVVVAKKTADKRHIRDISPEHVNDVVGWTRSPLILRELIDFSRTRIGFFPDHTPRAVEYAWIVNECISMPDKRIVIDAGAGVSCLPLYLSNIGKEVITVDNSPSIRKLKERAVWSEWGFLDYSVLDSRIRSFNEPFESASIEKKADVIYSVSVIEHLTTKARKAWLSRMKALLNMDGRILLTVDLLPPTDELWPLAEGKVVESNHGTFRTLIEEMGREGITIDYAEILRSIPGTRVDIGLISGRLMQ